MFNKTMLSALTRTKKRKTHHFDVYKKYIFFFKFFFGTETNKKQIPRLYGRTFRILFSYYIVVIIRYAFVL